MKTPWRHYCVTATRHREFDVTKHHLVVEWKPICATNFVVVGVKLVVAVVSWWCMCAAQLVGKMHSIPPQPTAGKRLSAMKLVFIDGWFSHNKSPPSCVLLLLPLVLEPVLASQWLSSAHKASHLVGWGGTVAPLCVACEEEISCNASDLLYSQYFTILMLLRVTCEFNLPMWPFLKNRKKQWSNTSLAVFGGW